MTEILKKSSNRSFGLVFFLVFFLIGAYLFFEKSKINYFLFIISLIFLILGIKNSSILTPLNILWTKLGLQIGKIVSPIILGFIFFGVVTPTGIIIKIIGKDLLRLKKNKYKTYWINTSKYKSTMKDQF